MEQTIPRQMLASARDFADHTAIEEDALRWSFAELAEQGLRAARAFLAAGIEPGDRIGIWAPNIHEWIVACLGAQSAGAIVATLNTRFKGAEAAYNLRKSNARILCTMGEFLGMDYVGALEGHDLPDLERTVTFRASVPGAEPWEDFLKAGEAVPEADARARAEAVSPDDVSDFLFTSGTTGNPKAVMTAHGQTMRTFEVWSEVVGLRAGDRYLIANPFFHSFGYKAGWLACLMRGATMLPHAVFDAGSVLERIGRDRIDVLPGPPAIYQSLLAHPEREKYDLSCLRLAVTGAAAIPVEMIHRMRDELGFEEIVTAYGLTETCGMVSICRPGDDPETIATTSGRAIPGVEVRLVDEQGQDVPTGKSGEVWVRGYNVMKGYFDDEEATRETIDAEGWLHTGDVAVMDEQGNLRITDRIKDMFIMGGFNCYPAEIENLLFGMEGVAQVAVIGVPDERMGEVGMAFVVPGPGAALTPDAVVAWSRENMANYKVPRWVEIVDALPATASGKVQKFQLRERAEAILAEPANGDRAGA